MSNIKQFEYEGEIISFEFADGNKMINATQMAKPFSKKVGHFLALKGTKEYILFLQSRYRDSDNGNREVLRVVQGGTPELQGTWMDEKLALKFASWLEVRFEAWVYDKIHELITTGKTEIKQSPSQNIIKSIRLIADQLEAHEKDITTIKDDISHIKDHIGDIEAKIISIDENYYSVSGYCSLHGIDCPLKQAQNWGISATKLSNRLGRPIGKAYDSKYGNVNTYHTDILEKIIK